MSAGSARLRVGIVGVGYMGTIHLKALRALPSVDVVAIAARSQATVEKVGAETGIDKLYTDHEAIIEDRAVDAVCIATPAAYHGEVAVAAAAAGKHVLCEKPMALTPRDARSMVEASERSGTRLAVMSGRGRLGIYPISANMAGVRALVPSLGRLHAARVSGPWRFRGRPGIDVLPNTKWFLERRLAGGGVLADLGCFTIDLLQYLTGDATPASVSAATFRGFPGAPVEHAYDVEEHASLFLRSAPGWTATIELANASYVARDDSSSIVLLGTEGALTLHGVPFTPGATLTLGTASPDAVTVPGESVRDQPGLRHESWDLPPARQSMYEDFVEACLHGTEPLASGRVALEVMRIQALAYASAERGTEVTLEELESSEAPSRAGS